MEMHGSDRTSGRTLSLSSLALRVSVFRFDSRMGRGNEKCTTTVNPFTFFQRHYRLLREELNKLPTPEGLEDLVEPLASPGSLIELSGTPGTPNTPPTSTSTLISNPIVSINNASASSNHVHHDIDTDVEMKKMVSKVCE